MKFGVLLSAQKRGFIYFVKLLFHLETIIIINYGSAGWHTDNVGKAPRCIQSPYNLPALA